MKFKCVIDNYRGRKNGMALILGVPDKEHLKVLKDLPNFMDKPLEVEILINAHEFKKQLSNISPDQRKKIYALFNDIANTIGDSMDNVKHNFKIGFLQSYLYDDFSLSNCSSDLAKDFIGYLIDFCFEHGIPLSEHPLQGFNDIDRYIALTIKNKVCAVCGEAGEVHHIDTIGMGNNRKKVDDSKYRKVSLCRVHHSEAHTIGWIEFVEKYHLG